MNCRVGAASDDESEVAFEQPGSGSFELAGSGSGSFWMTVLGWAGNDVLGEHHLSQSINCGFSSTYPIQLVS
jgi:hypothetical protein